MKPSWPILNVLSWIYLNLYFQPRDLVFRGDVGNETLVERPQ